MAPLGYIEILDSKGFVIDRVPIESFPIRIGRAYSNDVILADPYVCPVHLEVALNEHGQLTARDLGSINGLHPGNHAGTGEKSLAVLELQTGRRFRIGHTQLRYCSIDQALPPTLIDRESGRLRLSSPYAAATVVFAAFALHAYRRDEGRRYS